MSFLCQSLVWLALSGHLGLLNQPDWPAPHHLLTSLDMSLDAESHEVLDDASVMLLSQVLVVLKSIG